MGALNLDAEEARVLGVLLEKEVTTPDVYPLSINAVASGCNQKSSREPVMNLHEGAVRDALERLVGRALVREAGGAGGRTRRFAHRLDSRLFGTLEFSREERAALCVLLLRGPQTPGEIRSRTARLATYEDLDALQRVLDRLAARDDGPFVAALAREPGRREIRYRELLSAAGASAPRAPVSATDPQHPGAAASGRDRSTGTVDGGPLAALSARVAVLEARLAGLEEALGLVPEPVAGTAHGPAAEAGSGASRDPAHGSAPLPERGPGREAAGDGAENDIEGS